MKSFYSWPHACMCMLSFYDIFLLAEVRYAARCHGISLGIAAKSTTRAVLITNLS